MESLALEQLIALLRNVNSSCMGIGRRKLVPARGLYEIHELIPTIKAAKARHTSIDDSQLSSEWIQDHLVDHIFDPELMEYFSTDSTHQGYDLRHNDLRFMTLLTKQFADRAIVDKGEIQLESLKVLEIGPGSAHTLRDYLTHTGVTVYGLDLGYQKRHLGEDEIIMLPAMDSLRSLIW
ncbi:MAG: hypothetical protein ACQESG_05275 [Nanobdellota archaeon]